MSFIRCLAQAQPRKTGNRLDMIEGLLVPYSLESLCSVLSKTFYPLLSIHSTKEDRKLSRHDQMVASSNSPESLLCLLSAA